MRSPAELENLWRELQPGRRLQLRVSPRGDRLYVVDPAAEGGSEVTRDGGEMTRDGGEVTLEIVMLSAMRHAFPIHHWRPRP